LLRYAVIAAAIVALAVAAPRYAPDLFAAMLRRDVAPEAKPAEITPPAQIDRVEPVPPPAGRRVTIPADPSGHYIAEARINGRAVKVVVDTGATIVALTSETARRLGILPAQSAFTRPVATANGVVNAAAVTLSEIRLGGVSVRHVAAMVVPGDGLAVDLLGMSFLGRLTRFEAADGHLVLVE